MKVLIFGTGKFYQNRKTIYRSFDIQAFLDNDTAKQGDYLDLAPIVSPEHLWDYEFEYIIIVSIHRTAMRAQLESLGIPSDKILDFTQTGKISVSKSAPIYSTEALELVQKAQKENRILLLTHELSYTGAPLVLLQAAIILKKYGFSPIILSPVDGALKTDFLLNEIPVIVEEDISIYNHTLFEWLKNFSCVWVNTLYFSYIIRDLDHAGIPVIWWLHEGKIAYPMMFVQSEYGYNQGNVHIYADGMIALQAAKTYMPLENVELLVYGVPDFTSATDTGCHKKTIFAVIATIAYGKGQDIFVEAVTNLTNIQREEAEFWIIGDIAEEKFYRSFSDMIDQYPCIIRKSSLSHDELEKLYPQMDTIVCPSREDPMPVVLTEGMMNHKVCITSDRTGTAALMTHRENGLLFRSGDPADLAEQIAWVLNHKDTLKSIGAAARNLYETTFGLQCFEDHILDILEKVRG